MTLKYDQIVIGRGASALGFLHYSKLAETPAFIATSTLVVGRNDLWGNVAAKDPSHRFGQPAQIVSMPHQPAKSATVDKPEFQSAKDISGGLRDLEKSLRERKDLTFMDANVTAVRRGGIGFIVDLSRPQKPTKENVLGSPVRSTVEARRVIVATGFGPSSYPPVALPADVLKNLNTGLGGGDWRQKVMGGTEYLYSPVSVPKHDDFTVAIHGASATSSWAVLRAIALGAKKIVWIARGGFADANPAGRNSDVLKKASDNGWLVIANVGEIRTKGSRLVLKLVAANARDVPPRKLSTLGEAYKKFYAENAQSAAAKRQGDLDLKTQALTGEVVVDHYVYALGADPSLPGGAGQILGPLCAELEAVFDSDKRFGDVDADTTVALRNKTGDLWVVGAAVFRSVGFKGLNGVGDNFKNIAQMMTESGTPPEGIAAVMASLKAVTGYFEEKVNLQTADFKEIERWVGKLYQDRMKKPASDKTRRVLADQIVALRKHTVFGLSKDEVDRLTDPKNPFWDEMFTLDETGNTCLVDTIAAAA